MRRVRAKVRMKTFKTFLLVDYFTVDWLKEICFDFDFNFEFEKDPSKRFWTSKDGKSFLKYLDIGKEEDSGNYFPAQRIIIRANSQELAENVKDLIYAANNLVYPDSSEDRGAGFLIGLKSESKSSFKLNEKPYSLNFIKLENALIAFKIIQRIFQDKDLIYSLIKYNLSCNLDSFTPHSTNPNYGQVFPNYYSDFQYHVNAAYSINVAYSIIEELQLDIRSSPSNPTFNPSKTDFNEIVRDNLENRLNRINISTRDGYSWIMRGELSLLQRDIKPSFGVRIFPNHNVLFDERVELIEAIQRARYIRNFITAHKFRDITEFISPYDVFNIQTLARKLFLNKLGLWSEIINKK